MAVPEFLQVDAQVPDPVDDGDLARLESLVSTLKETIQNIDGLKTELEILEEMRKSLAQQEIPYLVRSRGLSEIRLRDQTKVVVKEELQVSVSEEKRPSFLKFLDKRGDMDIVKTVIYLPRMSPERLALLKELLDSNEYEYQLEQNVHPQTLKKYFKELLGIGDEEREEGLKSGKYLPQTMVAEVANVFSYFDTKLKK